ncbi:hypothetical protein QTI66_07780 [Variovorax sp. J22R133]|uniref:hypothetical protein n=1 Tax=Variovorax brevis TaxID=3053503 RepID=UPI00257666D4|nr:hypothetical protein [Variovorax sp. J22R133]MDM0112044.1 hypothetical protein [Variovorax sp. J22R133]
MRFWSAFACAAIMAGSLAGCGGGGGSGGGGGGGHSDARNGTYRVYAANGSKQTLDLNFDTMRYTMTDAAGVSAGGTFAADGTGYIFNSSRVTAPTNTARFRMTDNAVVGAFPFNQAGSTTAFAVQPFVASNSFVTSQAGLAGTYDRVGGNLVPGGTNGQNIRQVLVTTGGTQMQYCNDVAVTAITSCTSSLTTYNITPGTTANEWRITNSANAADTGQFAIAMVGGEKVYLLAGGMPAGGSPGETVFRIGVVHSAAWPASTAQGADSNGAWGSLNIDASSYVTNFVRPDGSNGSQSLPLKFPGIGDIKLGLAIPDAGTGGYWVVRNKKLVAVAGAGAFAGYMQIGLVN